MKAPAADQQPVRSPEPGHTPLWRTWHVDGTMRQLVFAVLLAAISFTIRLALNPWLGERQPFTPAFAFIAIAAWFATWHAGLLTAVICHVLTHYFILQPSFEWKLTSAEAVGAASYYLIAGVILFLGHSATTANRSLSNLVASLSEVNLRKTQFLALLAHELRNPLATLRAGVELLKTGALDQHESRFTQDMMDRQIAQMTHLIEDLLDIARIDQGKIVLRPCDIPVGGALADAVAAARTFTEAMSQEIVVNVSPQVDTIHADPARVAQVFINLLHNASKFSPAGSRITIDAQPADAGVAITVRDQGIGIPAGQLHAIFGTFVQLEHGHEAGLGLGLALVSKLMEMHGGSVQASSDGPGTGAAFTVVFPRGQALPADAPAPQSGVCVPQREPLRLLVVDDNRDAAESLAMLLQLKGHTVLTARDGETALQQARQHIPDAVFLDLGMPDMDGYEVARRLRQQIIGPQPTLIALTGWAGEEDQRRSLGAGFDLHLAKPVSIEALEEALKAMRPLAAIASAP